MMLQSPSSNWPLEIDGWMDGLKERLTWIGDLICQSERVCPKSIISTAASTKNYQRKILISHIINTYVVLNIRIILLEQVCRPS
ncbi:hypothetical protein glysoja_014202 [Glycine soja]|nr:hypothetical protein glysoja_014202 [Glycine soja]